ncbi:MAG: hypothetical protein FWG66_00060 [Spirochaetes bacterium]|nr:hypothetical protein [Spirochaetota bacterium]
MDGVWIQIVFILFGVAMIYHKVKKLVSLAEEQNQMLKSFLEGGNSGAALPAIEKGGDKPLSEDVKTGFDPNKTYIVREETPLCKDDNVNNVMTILREGETVEYIETGNLATVKNKTHSMWKVKAEYERVGFCFSGNLEKKIYK